MRICAFTHTQHLVLQQYPGRSTTCPNRSNPIATATSPAELDATVVILRDGDHLSPEGYVVEAGALAQAVKEAGTNDRSCEDVARQICDRVLALIGPRPAKDGILAVRVSLKNGPNIVSFEELLEVPAVRATKGKASKSEGRKTLAKPAQVSARSSTSSSLFYPGRYEPNYP